MAGYVRQSVADLINGADVTAPPLTAEFNQLASAFDVASGHTHDGSTGEAPQINLATAVAGYLQAANGGVGGKHNTTSATTPVVTNDNTQGYAPGSIWENTTTGRVYICVGNLTSAAVWRELVQVTSGNALVPATTDLIDLGTPTEKFQDLYLSGGASILGTATIGTNLIVTGTATLNGALINAAADINGGTIDATQIGATAASTVTGTTITGTNLLGPLTGSVLGDITGNSAGVHTGAVTGDLTGNVTAASGSSSFNDVTINGSLDMNAGTAATVTGLAEPVVGSDAATKTYVDTEVSAVLDAAPAALDTLNELAAALGDDENFSTTVTNSIAAKLPLAGGTMSGPVAMGTSKITGLGTPTAGTDATTKTYVDAVDSSNVTKTGDTMSGILAMGANKITDVADPTTAQDAATKNYIDVLFGATASASTSAANAATSETNAGVSETNAAASASDASTSETNAAASLASFTGQYVAQAGAPASADSGDLWFDTSAGIMKVYNGSGWVNAGSSVNGIENSVEHTATAGQTTFTATYDTGFLQVFLNGMRLDTADYTATNGSTVILGLAATLDDVVFIHSFGTFELADHYTKVASDARYAQVSDIGSTIQAFDATIVVDADIGVSVQAFDATIVVDADIGSTVEAFDANKYPAPTITGISTTAANASFHIASAGGITITLPVTPTAGNYVIIKDGTGVAADTPFTVARNGSNIASSATDLTFDKNFAEVVMTYVNATIGWSV